MLLPNTTQSVTTKQCFLSFSAHKLKHKQQITEKMMYTIKKLDIQKFLFHKTECCKHRKMFGMIYSDHNHNKIKHG